MALCYHERMSTAISEERCRTLAAQLREHADFLRVHGFAATGDDCAEAADLIDDLVESVQRWRHAADEMGRRAVRRAS